MLYILKLILKELERTDRKIKKDAYREGEIQEEIDRIQDFPELLSAIEQKASSLKEISLNHKNTIISTLSDLDAKFGCCVQHIETAQEMIRQLLIQFPEDEIDEILT